MDEWTKMPEMTNEELVVYAMGGCDRAIRLMMEKNEGLVVSKAKTPIYQHNLVKKCLQSCWRHFFSRKLIAAFKKGGIGLLPAPVL